MRAAGAPRRDPQAPARRKTAAGRHRHRAPVRPRRGLPLGARHERAGRGRLADILDDVSTDPFGNPVPSRTAEHPRPSADEVSADRFAGRDTVTAVVSRIGEPIQADAEILAGLEDAQIVAGAEVELRVSAGGVRLVGSSGDPVVLADDVARHLFVRR